MAADTEGKCTVILGAQWGDEGKGKLVDDLSQKSDIVARCAGGANAGHTIVVDGVTYKFHLLPSGLVAPKPVCLIGNGVVLDVVSLFEEIDYLTAQGIKNVDSRVKVSDRAHIVFKMHKKEDKARETARQNNSGTALGTTGKGIGPAYSSKMDRDGIRVCDLIGNFAQFQSKYFELSKAMGADSEDMTELVEMRRLANRIRPMVVDSILYLHDALKAGKSVLVEGANAAMLDIDHGTYPFVTSSNCTIGGVCTGLGVPPTRIGSVIGIVKAYSTRVGKGPFPTELTCEIGKHLQTVGNEYGTTTGRLRRCGWIDCVVLRYSSMINGYTSLNLTKLDVLTGLKTLMIGVSYQDNTKAYESMPADLDTLEKCGVLYQCLPGWGDVDISKVKNYNDLPVQAKTYVERIEKLVGIPIRYVGVGPGRDSTLIKE